jgi:hypothetical protein
MVLLLFQPACGGRPDPSPSLVGQLNAICSDVANAFTGRELPSPSAAVAADLSAGRITPASAAYLGQLADLFLSAGSEARARTHAIRATGSDRVLLDRYQQVTDRSFAALTAVHDDVVRADFASLTTDWRRVQEASQENSDLNVAFGLRACGSLDSPPST